ncbi:MAG: site-specific DNA-methyltransferase, partial [Mangrovibacterium sp.]
QMKLDLQSPDLVNENIEKLAALFPNCITESANGKAIDFDLLKQELNHAVVEGNKERYTLNWPGKREAILTANTQTTQTLRPVREDSVDFDNTENLYIEGDNLEVLKLLQESYLNQVKMIYIDPPYNTGKDFVYRDNFTMDSEEWLVDSGQKDEYGVRMVANPETAGRYHSDWLTMMYPRLKLARNLLKEDGVIFISIDDNEVHNLRKICDEIFGEGNFVAEICHKSRASISNDKIISPNHNTILFYAKNNDVIHENRKFYGLDPKLTGFDLSDERGDYRLVPVDGPGGAKKGNPYYEFLGILGYWRFSKETMQQKYEDGYVVKRGNSLYQKYYKTTAEKTRRTDTTWWDDAGLMSTATANLKSLMEDKTFDTPKPIELIIRMLKLTTFTNKSALILDFFSGSATTAHAVMQLNAEDGGNRKYICVQLPEATDEKSEAFKAGYKNICEIGKERIRRAGKKVKEEKRAKAEKDGLFADFTDTQDYGFRVYRLDSSNMQDVYYRPQDMQPNLLDQLADNVKPDRTPDDLLAQIMLAWGLPLSLKIEQAQVCGKQVFKVENNSLYACFDNDIDEAFAKEIAKEEPLRIVFHDNGFAHDTAKINVQQLLKQLSPRTEMKVI